MDRNEIFFMFSMLQKLDLISFEYFCEVEYWLIFEKHNKSLGEKCWEKYA